ncbi:hypothetical protein HS7_04090 [Sulfolobales archaeon HS-7]|nr:hypothetical protein HS7_04090 [Sulfolobales archaeon HS-7]
MDDRDKEDELVVDILMIIVADKRVYLRDISEVNVMKSNAWLKYLVPYGELRSPVHNVIRCLGCSSTICPYN